jgi:hypothetical protein
MGDSPDLPTLWEAAGGSGAERSGNEEAGTANVSQAHSCCSPEKGQYFPSQHAAHPPRVPASGGLTSGRPAVQNVSASMDVDVHQTLSGGHTPRSPIAGSVSTAPGVGIDVPPSSFQTPMQIPRPGLQPHTPQPFPVKLGTAATPSADVSSSNLALNFGLTSVPQGQSAWPSPVPIPACRQLFRPAEPEKSVVDSVHSSDDEARSANVGGAVASGARGTMSPPRPSRIVPGEGSDTSGSASSSSGRGSETTSNFERTVLELSMKPKVIAHVFLTGGSRPSHAMRQPLATV